MQGDASDRGNATDSPAASAPRREGQRECDGQRETLRHGQTGGMKALCILGLLVLPVECWVECEEPDHPGDRLKGLLGAIRHQHCGDWTLTRGSQRVQRDWTLTRGLQRAGWNRAATGDSPRARREGRCLEGNRIGLPQVVHNKIGLPQVVNNEIGL